MGNSQENEMRCQPATKFARRHLLTASGATTLTLGMSLHAFSQSTTAKTPEIMQPMEPGGETFIQRAFEMRQDAIDRGDQPYGAVIVRDEYVIGQSWSRVILDQDPTAHAEMAAIRDAARRLDSRDLGGAVLYSSSRPCPMCEAAAYWAGVSQMFHGHDMTSAGSPKLCR